MHTTDTKSRFIELRAKGWSLARIAAHLDVSRRTLVDWNQHSQGEIRLLKAVELEALHEKLLASHEAELNQLTEHLKRIEAELATRDLQSVSTENLYRLAGQLRRQLQRLRTAAAPPDQVLNAPPPPGQSPSRRMTSFVLHIQRQTALRPEATDGILHFG